MSDSMLHPEELLDRLRSGELSELEERKLAAHCAECSACAFEHAAIVGGAPQETAEDVAVVERVLAAALAAQGSREGAPTPTDSAPRGNRFVVWLAVAAAVAVFGGSAFAALRLGWIPTLAPEPTSQGRLPERPAPLPTSKNLEPPPEMSEAPPVDATPPVEADEPTPATPTATAEELYAQANAARRDGRWQQALALYKNLAWRHPTARQTPVALVAAGNLALHRLSAPRKAQPFFDRYLAMNPSGALALEARVGRALCLQQAGQRRRAQGAWRDILERHPNSVHAARARRELGVEP